VARYLIVNADVREIILGNWPQRFEPGELGDEVPLGEEGLGLDSVEIVEVVLACEERCGRVATEELFAGSPLTISLLVDHLAEA
jgi:acyl carrier protein